MCFGITKFVKKKLSPKSGKINLLNSVNNTFVNSTKHVVTLVVNSGSINHTFTLQPSTSFDVCSDVGITWNAQMTASDSYQSYTGNGSYTTGPYGTLLDVKMVVLEFDEPEALFLKTVIKSAPQ